MNVFFHMYSEFYMQSRKAPNVKDACKIEPAMETKNRNSRAARFETWWGARLRSIYSSQLACQATCRLLI